MSNKYTEYEQQVWQDVQEGEPFEGVPAICADELNRMEMGISNAVRKTGDTMTGALKLSGAPTDPTHAASKNYVDENSCSIFSVAFSVPVSGTKIPYGKNNAIYVGRLPAYNNFTYYYNYGNTFREFKDDAYIGQIHLVNGSFVSVQAAIDGDGNVKLYQNASNSTQKTDFSVKLSFVAIKKLEFTSSASN